ncbi:MAG: hypothetical protein R3F19_20050 [Verrucomicrobiales bacterium]
MKPAMCHLLSRGMIVVVLLLGGVKIGTLPAQEALPSDAVHRVETGLRALVSEGCSRREPVWLGEVLPGQRVLLPLFFFKENHYVLVLAADDVQVAESALDIEMLDLVGVPIACHTGAGEGRIALAARPVLTGTAYLSMTLPKGSKPLKIAVGCAFK